MNDSTKVLIFESDGRGGCTCLGFDACTDAEIVIPPLSSDGYRIVRISAGAFRNFTSIRSVTIPGSVADIEMLAFAGCAGLRDIFYKATKEQWATVRKSPYWRVGTGEITIHCTDGDLVLQNDEKGEK